MQAQSITDWQKSNDSLQTRLKAAVKEKATISAAIEAKDKELENFREGQYYDEFSDSTHHTRQNRYKTENDSLCSDLDRTTRNRNELEYEYQGLRVTLCKNAATMEIPNA
jgi:hypothetical protein